MSSSGTLINKIKKKKNQTQTQPPSTEVSATDIMIILQQSVKYIFHQKAVKASKF